MKIREVHVMIDLLKVNHMIDLVNGKIDNTAYRFNDLYLKALRNYKLNHVTDNYDSIIDLVDKINELNNGLTIIVEHGIFGLDEYFAFSELDDTLDDLKCYLYDLNVYGLIW